MSVDPTKLLPNELLSNCIAHANIATVLCASHVCARWRVIARASPAFWRTIRLAATSNNALDFFRARITYTSSPGIEVQILIPARPRHLAREARIQADVAVVAIRVELEKNLDRIASLLISSPKPDMRIIAVSLAGRADILSRLILRIPQATSKTGDTALIWEVQWVPMHAPQLRLLVLENIGLPLGLPSRWFTAASTVKIFYTQHITATIPKDIFHRFPFCQNIKIEGRTLSRLRLASPSSTAPQRDRPYNLITLSTDAVVTSMLPLIPYGSSTQVIDVYFSGGYDMNTLVAHLDDPLKCSLHYDQSVPAVCVVFTADVLGSKQERMRVANLPGRAMLDPESTLLLKLMENIMPRVARLKVDLPNLAILCRIGPMYNVRMLAIDVKKEASSSDWSAVGLVAGWARTALPDLDEIVIRSRPQGLPLPCAELVQMLLNRLKGDSGPGEVNDWPQRIEMSGFAPASLGL